MTDEQLSELIWAIERMARAIPDYEFLLLAMVVVAIFICGYLAQISGHLQRVASAALLREGLIDRETCEQEIGLPRPMRRIGWSLVPCYS